MSKTVLITGASSGFGRDTAETLARAGHRVFASMRDLAGRNGTHVDALRAKGIAVVELDVTDEASVERGVAQVLAQAKRLDVLINNAGIGSAGVSESFTTDQLRALFDVNVFGIQRTLRAALPAFRSQGAGLVVNIGSFLGRVTFPFFGLYGASKFALEALTDSYRYELSQLGVDVPFSSSRAPTRPTFSRVSRATRRRLAWRGLRRNRRDSRQDGRNVDEPVRGLGCPRPTRRRRSHRQRRDPTQRLPPRPPRRRPILRRRRPQRPSRLSPIPDPHQPRVGTARGTAARSRCGSLIIHRRAGTHAGPYRYINASSRAPRANQT